MITCCHFVKLKLSYFLKCNLEAISSDFIPIIVSSHTTGQNFGGSLPQKFWQSANTKHISYELTLLPYWVRKFVSLSKLLQVASYRIAGKFGKGFTICQLKPSKLALTINNVLVDNLLNFS